MTNLLPKTAQWISENKDQQWQTIFSEYYYNIEYHFNNAQGLAQSMMDRINLINGKKVSDAHAQIADFEPQSFILLGDLAIREASSVIEMALMMVNYVLSLNVPQRNLRWKPIKTDGEEDNASLRLAMSKNPKYTTLVSLIDSVFDSAEYILLAEYRNWITHIGAPLVATTFDPNQPIAIPADVMNQGSPDKVNERITNYLRLNIYKHVSVICRHFVHRVNQYVGTPKESDPSLHATDVAITKGSLFDNKKDFKNNNPVPIGKDEKMYAGEKLRVYTLFEYTGGIQEVVMYIHQFVSKRLDYELHKVLIS